MKRALLWIGVIVAAAVTSAMLALGSGEAPYGPQDMVPVGSRSAERHGEARLEDLRRMSREGGRVPVFDDGELVGHMTQEGFQPAER